MRGMRRIGLVLVDKGGRGVDGTAIVEAFVDADRRRIVAEDAICSRRRGGARQHHEIQGAGRGAVERIIRLQRDHHRAIAALVDEVEAVIEELAEQREP